jgi:hypothetical protein
MKSSLLILAVLALCVAPDPAPAQTSVGFTDPADVSTLLDYRLPDWGYRTVKLGLGSGGEGRNQYGSLTYGDHSQTFANARQGLYVTWHREGEARIWSVSAGEEGDWSWERTGTTADRSYQSYFREKIDLSGSIRDYARGDAYLLGSADVSGRYDESRTHPSPCCNLYLERDLLISTGLGAGYGRVRDVTPLLQAQRLSERLRALGREPLSHEDVLRLAGILARRGGYQRVFDRPDRHLWQDVLEPLLGRGEPLSPYEVLYLRDVLQEDLGSREEGSRVELSASAGRSTTGGFRRGWSTNLGPAIDARWTHNLSLDRQLALAFDTSYLWGNSSDPVMGKHEQGFGTLSAQHLWVVADRAIWTTSISGAFMYSEDRDGELISRGRGVGVQSAYRFYIEDRVSLSPIADVLWRRTETGDRRHDEFWNWQLSFSLTYELENLLF